MKALKPAIFVPTLYFLEGLPYALVVITSVVFYKNLGQSLEFIGHATSALYLAWVFKFAWAPLVDLIGSKRGWIVVAQAMLAVLCLAFSLAIGFPESQFVSAISTCVMQLVTPFQGVVGSSNGAQTSPESSHAVVYVTLVCFGLMALASATQDVAIDGYYIEVLSKEQQSFFVGVRGAVYKIAWLFGQGLLVILVGLLVKHANLTVNRGWAVAFGLCGVICLSAAVLHYFGLPKSNRVQSTVESENHASLQTFLTVFRTFFIQEKIVWIVLYILIFRLGDAFVIKMGPPFLMDSAAKGGLAYSNDLLGVVSSVGLGFLLLGGIVGGIVVSKYGLKRTLMPTAIIQNASILLYFFMAQFRPGFYVVSAFNAIEQLGYGLGNAAYTVFLLSTVKGQYKAGHYAVATALMALGIMLPGFFSGDLAQALGYKTFFLVSFLAAIPGMITILLLPLEDK